MLTQVEGYLSGLTTTEGRVLASVILLVTMTLVALVFLPFVFRRFYQLLMERVVTGRAEEGINVVLAYIPRTVTDAIIRLSQGFVFVIAGLGLLVIWGLIDTAQTALSYLGGGAPIVVQVALTVVLGLLAYVWGDQLQQWVTRIGAKASWMTDHQQEIVTRTGQLGIFLVFGLLALSIWNVNLQGLLVGAGFLGIVVGLAARQTLGSLIAGFVLMFSRPFTIGDWVQIGDEEGVVTDITIINTRLENFDGEVVVIPNDNVSNQAIVNRSKRGVLRLRIDVGIDYEADPERAKHVAMETIKEIDIVADGPPPQIFRNRSVTRQSSWRCGSGSIIPRRPGNGTPSRRS